MSPDQLAGMFRDPLEAMKYLDELGKQTEQKRKMAAQKAGEEAWSRVQLEGDVGQRILSVQSAIQAAGAAGADTSKLNQHLNALLSQQQQAATERHQRAQEGISAGNLAVSRANLGLRQQELSLSKSSNPAERYAAEMFDQPFNRLTTAQRAQVNDRVSAESLERAQQMGAVQAGQRATPAQQTEELAAMQSSLDTLDFIEQKLNDEFVGPVRGGMQAYAMEKAGGMSEQEIDFRAALASYENILTLLRSGAAVTASESVRLTRETPKATDRPEQLRGKLRTARQILQNAMKRRKEALVTGGYGQVPTFTQPDVSTPERPNATHRYNPETGRIEAID
jgi:hypothetical protein